jgi:homoserine kinase type II
MRPLTGGLINATYLLTEGERRFVVRSYQRTKATEDIEYELLAVEFLSTAGFPTAAPVRSLAGDLYGDVAGRTTAMFEYIDGSQPPSREGGFGSFDLRLGCETGAALARMHLLTWHLNLPVRRTERGDPLRQIGEFLADVQSWEGRELVPGLEQFIAGLEEASSTIALHSPPTAEMPTGLVHADLSERNVLVDADGHLLALLDFDDCLESYRLYDLCSLLSAWGLDDQRRLDIDRASRLVAAYTAVRPLSPTERELLPALLMIYIGSAGCEFITGRWRRHAFVDGVIDSYSATTFLWLHGDSTWQAPLQAAGA